MDFLSIDIANIDDLVGIEVDGPAHFINILDGYSDTTERSNNAGNHDQSNQKLISSGGTAIRMGKKKGWEFTSSTQRQVNGATALKHRILCHLGWCMIHLPFWEWRDVSGNKGNEELYCNELLEEIIG